MSKLMRSLYGFAGKSTLFYKFLRTLRGYADAFVRAGA